MRRCALFLPLGASVLAFAACGGGPPPVIVTPHYAARVSHLCLLAADQFRELHLTNTIGDYRHDATAIVQINSVFLNQLAKLNPPTELARPAAAYARAIAKSAKDQQNAVVAARAGNTARFQSAIGWMNYDAGATRRYAKAIQASGCY